MGDSRQDDRFAHIANDPRFRAVPKQEKKVKIDKRFASMFHDKKFKLKYSMDKRGLPMQHSTSDDLKKFYNVSSESEDNSEAESDDAVELKGNNKSKALQKHSPKILKTAKSRKDKLEKVTSSSESEDEEKANSDASSNSEESESEVSKNANKNEMDLARGEGNVESSSSSDESDNENAEEESGLFHDWGEHDAEAAKTDDTSKRLAVCNMDWDRIKAKDLYVLFNSFKPPEGIVLSVKVYPSEYGLARLKEETERGPAELVEEKLKSDEEDYAETEEGSKFHMEKLRKYQLNRLKYYYALVECDSSETASKLYSELEGMEYESSAAQLDLRFVPDDMLFEHEPKSVCTSLPEMAHYEPNLFTTTALQQAKVDLTWDETDQDRVRLMEKAFEKSEGNETDLQAYLASSSSEDEGIESVEDDQEVETKPKFKNQKSQIAKYKELLAELEKEENAEDDDIDMEIKWEPGLKIKAEKSILKNQKNKDLTIFEEYLEKKKEKKKQKRMQTNEGMEPMEDKEDENEMEGEEQPAFSDDEIPDGVDLNDPFFKHLDSPPKQKKESSKKKRKFIRGEEITEESENAKAELELLMMGETDERKHFKLDDLVEQATASKTKKKKMRKKMLKLQKDSAKIEKTDDFKINVADPRFSALYSSALFNIDPSDSHFKKTQALEAIITEKQKRRIIETNRIEAIPSTSYSSPTNITAEKKKMANSNLSLLVNSVKNKTANFKRKK